MKITTDGQYLNVTWGKQINTRHISRIELKASNGATGVLIWDHPKSRPTFLGDNMTQEQSAAGEKAKHEILQAKHNIIKSTLDFLQLFQDGGWHTIYPVPYCPTNTNSSGSAKDAKGRDPVEAFQELQDLLEGSVIDESEID